MVNDCSSFRKAEEYRPSPTIDTRNQNKIWPICLAVVCSEFVPRRRAYRHDSTRVEKTVRPKLPFELSTICWKSVVPSSVRLLLSDWRRVTCWWKNSIGEAVYSKPRCIVCSQRHCCYFPKFPFCSVESNVPPIALLFQKWKEMLRSFRCRDIYDMLYLLNGKGSRRTVWNSVGSDHAQADRAANSKCLLCSGQCWYCCGLKSERTNPFEWRIFRINPN